MTPRAPRRVPPPAPGASARAFVLWAESRFRGARLTYGHGTDNARDDAVFLVFCTLGLPYDVDDATLDAPLADADRERVLDRVEARVTTRSPTAYVVGEGWFAGLRFHVDPRVLVPRSPIAELVETGFAPFVDEKTVRHVADLGTGSGCIAVACALAFPEAEIDAIDISADALAVARLNIARHGVADRVHAVQSDLFAAMPGARYDLIVANPPYVPEGELPDLPDEYRHEPALALAAGPEGLAVVDRLLPAAAEHLADRGVLVCEVGDTWERLAGRYPQLPFLWLDLERGGEGVFLLEARDLRRHFPRP